MNSSNQTPAPSAWVAASVKTAVLVLALGFVALVAELTLTAPQATPLAGGANVSAVAPDASLLPELEIPMIAWDRPSERGSPAAQRPIPPARRPVAVDPSVPSADSVVPAREEPQPATF